MTDFSRFMIVTDLDGTFAMHNQLIPRNLAALERFRAGGGIFTIATGRAHLNLRSAIGDPTTLVNAPVICDNGAYLYDFAQNKNFHEDLLCVSDAKELIAFMRRDFPNVRYSVSAVSAIRSEENAGYVAKDMKTYEQDAVCISPADEWPLDDWYKLLVFDDTPRLCEVSEALVAHFGRRFLPTFSNTWILEVQYPDINKALGLQKLKKHLNGIENRTVIACGDFDNDIQMLQAADISICPANAQEQVKACADHVLCHCSEGLTADVIERIENGLITPKIR